MKKKQIAVLGATGSIGKSALDIISRDRENFEVVLLSAHSKKTELEVLSKDWPSATCALGGNDLLTAIKDTQPDITINGIAGSAGLEPSIAAIQAGSTLALANKETVVMACDIVFDLARKKNVKIIPVDSEHSAIFKLLEAHGEPSEIILTASGGPFKNFTMEELKNVKAKDALAHPTWNMGPKITIDSASMANKGLELIEACAFFNMPPSKIKIVIHRQSIVHSMIRLCNGVIYAQLSKPDMRNPIHDAIYWPQTSPLSLEELNFDALTLDFEKPDTDKFPMLNLARLTAEKGGLYPCAYNAANEQAVGAFLEQKIGFTDIPKITQSALDEDYPLSYSDIETVLKADTDARKKALLTIEKMSY